MKTAKVKKTGNKPGGSHRVPFTSPGPGRPKGVPNKLSGTAKGNIEKVFEAMGGWEGMKKWAASSEKNRTTFYSEIYPRLLPMDVAHSGEVNAVLHFDYSNGNGNGYGK